MEKWWFNSILRNRELAYKCGLSKSMDRFGPIENTSVSEDPLILTDMDKIIVDYLVYYLGRVKNIRKFLSKKSFLVRDSQRNSYSIYFAIEKKKLEIDNDHLFLSERDGDHYMYDTESSSNNNINSFIENYIRSQICIENSILGDSDKYNDSDFYSYIYSTIRKQIRERERTSTKKINGIATNINGIATNINGFAININGIATNIKGIDFTKREGSNDLDETLNYTDFWIECENCYGLNYKKILKSKMHICEHCGYHLKISSSDRIELSIDTGTWNPMDEDMISVDPIEFHSEEEPYKDRINYYQKTTGLTEAVQTGTGQLNGIPVAIGIMDFEFMGGSMGAVVGEKITRLVEYATNQLLPLILVCASGGARMQEGSFSLMQMAKISSALYDYQLNKKLFYVSILTSPTTGGVTASFGMLGDIIIAEPNAYIAFAGKRVIEQTLNKAVPEGSQAAEYLFQKGLFDAIVPRNTLKGVLSELFQLHAFFPLTQNEKESRS